MISFRFSRAILLALLLGHSGVLFSQSQLPLVLDSGVDVNKKFASGFTLNMGARYRDLLVSDLGSRPLAPNSRHLQLSTNLNYQLGLYDRLGGGLMYRFNSVGKDGISNELRFTQEYIHITQINAVRLAHRLKSDQRLFKSLSTEFRFRYRLSADFPLNGLKLDPGEFYALIATETLLNSGEAFKPEWDQRFNLAFGNQITPFVKAQLDLQYRAESFSNQLQNQIFLFTSVIVGL
jgi:hypothetical protein